MRDIIFGLILIAMGFVFGGGSIFLGDSGVVPIVCDGIAILFILHGSIKVIKKRKSQP